MNIRHALCCIMCWPMYQVVCNSGNCTTTAATDIALGAAAPGEAAAANTSKSQSAAAATMS